jgi:nucleoside-diphosphate-sugar epimerase
MLPFGTRYRLFVFGLGYSALALAKRARAQGWRVAGTCRSAEKKAALEALGIEAHLFDRGRPLAEAGMILGGTTHLLSSVPPDDAGDAVLDQHAADIAKLPSLRWVGYLSTTGVYGNHDGGWVNETTARRPTGKRGQERVDAEDGWLALMRMGIAVHLFRLAAIYGPGRSALDTVRAGKAKRIIKPGQIFSRIHVDDIVAVLEASIMKPNAGAAYNLCDDDPAPPQDVIAYACALLGVPAPPDLPWAEAAPHMTEMARSFYADSKRVTNRRIKDELGVTLAYPDYRAGLKALLAQQPA